MNLKVWYSKNNFNKLFNKHKGHPMKELLETLIKNLVDTPEDVKIDEKADSDQIRFKIKVKDNDLGKVIGKKGQTISALRTYFKAIGAKSKSKRIIIEVDEF